MLCLIEGAPLPPMERTAEEPFFGVATDGTPVSNVSLTIGKGFGPLHAAFDAMAHLDMLSADYHARTVSEIDSTDWQLWTNAFLTYPEHEFRRDELFDAHRRTTSEFVNSLSAGQQGSAVLFRSINPGDLPKCLCGAVDGLHRAGAGRNILVLPREGLQGTDRRLRQRECCAASSGP
ncbi:hypothetical protein [Rhodococcus wratislaviensis]|uniref:hypothetical protein n=1 Tax=Rhodococcus wratislaviensis TaxID=44752 RepID=UPI0036676D6A